MRPLTGIALAGLLGCAHSPPRASLGPLPGLYFRLLQAGAADLEGRAATDPDVKGFGGAVLAAAVLYARPHPANPSHGDRTKLDLALKIGDRLAEESEAGRLAGWLNHRWFITLWLDAYRLLERDLGEERRARWRKEMERHVGEMNADVTELVDYPRYVSPFIRTSPNHLSIWASTLHLAGRVFGNPGWERLGGRAMHRFAAEEQAPDGYWGEHSESGPTTGYNYLTFTSVALYYEHSRDPAALEALRRGTDFHAAFTYPDGRPVEVVNDRNRHWDVSPWGHFGFSNFADGRRYAAFLAERLRGRRFGGDALGRLGQNALYFHEGPEAEIPQDRARDLRRLKVPAAVRRSAPWTVCLSGLISTQAVTNQFYIDRQGHLSVFHEKLGLIITGANSKRQPELATFSEKVKGETYHLPTNSVLETGDAGDRLSLAYHTFFADLRMAPPAPDAVRFEVTVVERGRIDEARMTLQLRLKPGEVLETATSTVAVGAERIELGPEVLGGRIRHAGWTLHADPSARLEWPVYPFNPYSNGPEQKIEHAVAALSVPLRPQPVAPRLRKHAFTFTLEAGR